MPAGGVRAHPEAPGDVAAVVRRDRLRRPRAVRRADEVDVGELLAGGAEHDPGAVVGAAEVRAEPGDAAEAVEREAVAEGEVRGGEGHHRTGEAPVSSATAPNVFGPTASGEAPPPVSPASTPTPPALNARVGALAGRPVAAGADQGAAAAAVDGGGGGRSDRAGATREDGQEAHGRRSSAARCVAPADAITPAGRAPRGAPHGRGPGTTGSCRRGSADDGDARVGGAPAGVATSEQDRRRAVDPVGLLDVDLEAVPEVLDLLEPAADPAVAAVGRALVEQAEDRLGLDVGVDLREHAREVARGPGGVETLDRVDFRLAHARPQSFTARRRKPLRRVVSVIRRMPRCARTPAFP